MRYKAIDKNIIAQTLFHTSRGGHISTDLSIFDIYCNYLYANHNGEVV